MEIVEAQLAITYFFQGLGSILQQLMYVITQLGELPFYILIAPALYWCVDALVGLRVTMMLLLSVSFNGFLKLVFKTPRPYWIDPKVKGLADESSFSMPSGHAMNATSVFGQAALESKDKGLRVIVIALVFLIGISRIVLGVHFLSDIVVGWSAGLLLLVIFNAIFKRYWQPFMSKPIAYQLVVTFLISLLLFLPALLLRSAALPWVIPPRWLELGGEINPLSLTGSFMAAGCWMGMIGGFLLLRDKQGVLQSKAGKPWQRLLRYPVGIAGVAIIYLFGGKLIPDDPTGLHEILTYFHFLVLGLWVTWLAPLLFKGLKLASIKK